MKYGEKHWKKENTTVRLEIWQENSNTWKMKNRHCRTWNMARKLKKVENEKHTLQDLEYGEKNRKTWKMRSTHCKSEIWRETLKTQKNRNTNCRTWNMERNTKKRRK